MTAMKPNWPEPAKGPMSVKLVRDRAGDHFARPLGPGESLKPANSLQGKVAALTLKLHEETQEIAEAPGDPAEYADALEVLLELASANNVSWDSIEKALLQKREDKGGFRRGMILTRRYPV